MCNACQLQEPHLYNLDRAPFQCKNMTDITTDGSWEKSKDKLRLKFESLTNNDQVPLEGKKEEVIARLQLKLGKTKEELEKIISKLL